ncbi:hypothetical protein MRB53_039545 [Persea americana]|nr:hypothetical protein MRB53_039545 [Persea americana]
MMTGTSATRSRTRVELPIRIKQRAYHQRSSAEQPHNPSRQPSFTKHNVRQRRRLPSLRPSKSAAPFLILCCPAQNPELTGRFRRTRPAQTKGQHLTKRRSTNATTTCASTEDKSWAPWRPALVSHWAQTLRMPWSARPSSGGAEACYLQGWDHDATEIGTDLGRFLSRSDEDGQRQIEAQSQSEQVSLSSSSNEQSCVPAKRGRIATAMVVNDSQDAPGLSAIDAADH